MDAKQVQHLAISSRPPRTSSTRIALVFRAYIALTKPRVVALIVFTAVVGMLLGTPQPIDATVFVLATVGIALAAGSAAAFNHVLDRRADAVMPRTRARPLPTHQLSATQAVIFAVVLAVVSAAILIVGVNPLTTMLTLFALVGYSVIYTIFLKPRTPQNIVIGGAAGAAPPLLGWTAVTGSISLDAVLLFLIIFIWTPPHFWSLALYRAKEYAAVGVPMLPVTHGSEFTRKSILAYTLALAVVTTLPWVTGMSGTLYLVGAVALNIRFVAYAWRLYRRYSDALSSRTFRYSINYLAALFALLLMDRYGPAIGASLQAAAADLLL